MQPRLSGHVVAACRARSMPCSARPAERRRSHRRSAKLPPPALVNNACPYLIRIARYHGRGAHACLPCGRDNAPHQRDLHLARCRNQAMPARPHQRTERIASVGPAAPWPRQPTHQRPSKQDGEVAAVPSTESKVRVPISAGAVFRLHRLRPAGCCADQPPLWFSLALLRWWCSVHGRTAQLHPGCASRSLARTCGHCFPCSECHPPGRRVQSPTSRALDRRVRGSLLGGSSCRDQSQTTPSAEQARRRRGRPGGTGSNMDSPGRRSSGHAAGANANANNTHATRATHVSSLSVLACLLACLLACMPLGGLSVRLVALPVSRARPTTTRNPRHVLSSRPYAPPPLATLHLRLLRSLSSASAPSGRRHPSSSAGPATEPPASHLPRALDETCRLAVASAHDVACPPPMNHVGRGVRQTACRHRDQFRHPGQCRRRQRGTLRARTLCVCTCVRRRMRRFVPSSVCRLRCSAAVPVPRHAHAGRAGSRCHTSSTVATPCHRRPLLVSGASPPGTCIEIASPVSRPGSRRSLCLAAQDGS